MLGPSIVWPIWLAWVLPNRTLALPAQKQPEDDPYHVYASSASGWRPWTMGSRQSRHLPLPNRCLLEAWLEACERIP